MKSEPFYVFPLGRNEKGQLGHGDTLRRDVPTLIECLKDVNIVDAACGRNHTLILSGRLAYIYTVYTVNVDYYALYIFS